MGEGAGGGEAERAGLEAFLDDGSHLLDVLRVGVLVAGAAVAHDVGADSTVGDLCADVDGFGQAVEEVEVFGEGFPAPFHALGEGGAGDVFDAFHETDEPVAAVGGGGGEADAAVAHDDGGDAVPEGGGEEGVPGDLAVEVGVDVDEAGGDEFAVGVDFFAAEVVDFADERRRRPSSMATSALAGGRAGAVDDESVADDEIVHGGSFGLVVAVGAVWQMEGNGGYWSAAVGVDGHGEAAVGGAPRRKKRERNGRGRWGQEWPFITRGRRPRRWLLLLRGG